jgi:hypothetical protein
MSNISDIADRLHSAADWVPCARSPLLDGAGISCCVSSALTNIEMLSPGVS